MFDEQDSEKKAESPERGHPVAGEDAGGTEEPGRAKEATPEIGEDAEQGQTSSPAPEDDVGVPDEPGEQKE